MSTLVYILYIKIHNTWSIYCLFKKRTWARLLTCDVTSTDVPRSYGNGDASIGYHTMSQDPIKQLCLLTGSFCGQRPITSLPQHAIASCMPVTPQLYHHMKSRCLSAGSKPDYPTVPTVNNDATTSATEVSGAGVVISQLQCRLVEL